MSYINTFDKKVGKRSDDYRHDPGSYDYFGLAHWWAYNYGYKTTAGDRMKADGNRIKSYTTVIGRMFDPAEKGEQPFVLLSSGRYSNTTVTHMSAIRRAVSHMNYMFISNPDPFYKEDHIANLRALLSALEHLAEEYPKKRKESTRLDVIRSMISNKRNAEKYASYFKLRNSSEYKQIGKFPMPTDENFAELIEQSTKDKMAAEARAKAKKARALKKENKEKADKVQAKLKAWLNGDNVYVNSHYLEKVYLRIKDGIIETTENAHIGMMDAMKAYLRFKKGTLKEGMHIGPYTYGGIDNGKNAHVGCHIIPLKDIDLMVGAIIAERDAYIEDDRRTRDAEYEAEMEEMGSLDEIMGELAKLDESLEDIASAMGVPASMIGENED